MRIDSYARMAYTLRMIQNLRPLCISAAIYEAVRIGFILTFRPEASILLLPPSWYAAVPYLVFPLILLFLAYHAAQTETDCGREKPYAGLYGVAKLMSALGLLFCIRAVVPYALAYGQVNDFYSLKRAGILMIFLLIDVILCIVFLLRTRGTYGRSTDGENLLCK